MNKIVQVRRRTTNGSGQAHGNGGLAPPATSPADTAVRGQALQVDAMLKSLARKVLVDDDPAYELPIRQFRVCVALYEGARSMSELSRELGVSQSAITQLADRLETARLVVRGPVGDDRRVRSLQLTERARMMLKEREDRRLERVIAILDHMSEEDRRALLSSLAVLEEAANEDD
jgi:DNA-binding MarR family transcriptional regulator